MRLAKCSAIEALTHGIYAKVDLKVTPDRWPCRGRQVPDDTP